MDKSAISLVFKTSLGLRVCLLIYVFELVDGIVGIDLSSSGERSQGIERQK